MNRSRRPSAYLPQLQRFLVVLMIGATLVLLTAMGLKP